MLNQAGDSSLRNGFFEFIYWYRIAALTIVVLFKVFHISEVKTSIIVFAFAYNILIRVFRSNTRELIRKIPPVILVDILVSFALIALTGGYKSSFQLYTLCSVMSGAFLLGYNGALAIAALQSILYYFAFYINGFRVVEIMKDGEQIISTYLEYFLTGLSIAYISDLVNILGETSEKKEALERDLDETLTVLQASPDLAELSKRELQVLCLIMDGKTVEQAANVLSISRESAKTYLSRMYRKIGVTSRYEAINKALESVAPHD
ncbi:MAG: helix-turn-helix transcriptional regulator [Rubrobacteridae bacterium]|nr:helix-turn-helix transcriptional regulator [Rubrobacteridae bacterium]